MEGQAEGIFGDLAADPRSSRELTAADEQFHPGPAHERSWTETSWWATLVPEHNMVCWVYLLFRKNIGLVDAGVWVFDDTTHLPWQMPYARFRWHLPFPDGQLTDLTVGGNIQLRCIEPFTKHHISYRDRELVQLDLDFEALLPPHAFGVKEETGHLCQPLWATGEVVLDGKRLAIDGPALRDRSWGPRPDSVGRKAYLSFGISRDVMFEAMAVYEPDGTTMSMLRGSLYRDGVWSRVVRADRRVVARDDGPGPPLRIELFLEDEDGRTLTARGTGVSAGALWTQPSIFSWISLIRWSVDGQEVWGEDDEGWTPETLAHTRRRLRGPDPFTSARGLDQPSLETGGLR